MVAVYIVCGIFLVMGIIFLLGKGGFLIAGYNTASKEEKAKYDEKRLNRCFAIWSFYMAAVAAACGYVDTDWFATHVGLPFIIVGILFILIAAGTYCKKKS